MKKALNIIKNFWAFLLFALLLVGAYFSWSSRSECKSFWAEYPKQRTIYHYEKGCGVIITHQEYVWKDDMN